MDPKPPKAKTGKQVDTAHVVGVGGTIADIFAGLTSQRQLYDKMLKTPTVRLARGVRMGPVIESGWTIQSDDNAPEGAQEFIQKQNERLWPRAIQKILLALDNGFAPFEKLWDLDENRRAIIRKLKPLNPDITDVEVDDNTGAYAGLSQGKITLTPAESFTFTHDGPYGQFRGRSLLENIIDEWKAWKGVMNKTRMYATKAGGVIVMIEYPPGKSLDANGAEIDNYKAAKEIMRNLEIGNSVYMPNLLAAFAEELAKKGIDIKDLRSWKITLLEAGNHGEDLVLILRHLESQMMRGFLVPERTATEGQAGTKAEAGIHGSIALSASGITFTDIVRHWNSYVIDKMLILNYGITSKGSVYMVGESLSKEKQAFFRQILDKILTAPGNVGLLDGWINMDRMKEVAGVPKGTGAATPLVGAVKETEDKGNDDG